MSATQGLDIHAVLDALTDEVSKAYIEGERKSSGKWEETEARATVNLRWRGKPMEFVLSVTLRPRRGEREAQP